MKHVRLPIGTIVCVAVILSVAGVAPQAFAQAQDNGIVVGQAKLYDERSLESLLSSIQAGLSGSHFVNAATVAQNEGMIQGGEITTSQVGFAETQTPRVSAQAGAQGGSNSGSGTGASAGASGGSGQTGSGSGGAKPASAESGKSGTGSSFSGPDGYSHQQIPSIPAFSSDSVGISAPLAVSSEDMLQQQVGLSFQATNLELLLEHALSDRLIFTKSQGAAAPRALAVLGFQVTVEPTDRNKYAVAEAEITITSPPETPGRPEVAMMLPQDKTYNVAKVTSDSHTISLGAFAQPFGGALGAGGGRSSAYVVYDVDTIALQRPIGSDPNAVSFAWQFRPVLGAKSVQPGTRQVYVLLSLPVTSDQDYTPVISVKTYWKHLDTRSETVSATIPADETCRYTLDTLSIHKLSDYDDGLQPVIKNIEMDDAGNGQVYVEASGENFTKNMTVVLNGVSYNVFEQGGRLLSFTAPLRALSYANPRLVGPYGLPVEMKLPALTDSKGAAIAPGQAGYGLRIKSVSAVPIDADYSAVRVQLVSRDDSTLAPALPAGNAQLVVTIGDTVYGLDDNPIGLGSDSDDSHTSLDLHVPRADLAASQKVTVRYLFAGDAYRDDFQLPVAAFSVDSVAVVSCDPPPAHSGSGGSGNARGEGSARSAVVLGLQGSFHKSLTAFLYNGSTPVEFDPTVSISDSFLLLQAAVPAGRRIPTRGATATYAEPPSANDQDEPQKCYNLALLTVSRGQLAGAKYIVLYEPGSPAQMLPLASCLKSLQPSTAPKNETTIPFAPTHWEMWGTWSPSSPESASLKGMSQQPVDTGGMPGSTNPPAQGGNQAPGTPPSEIVMELGTKTVTGTGTGRHVRR